MPVKPKKACNVHLCPNLTDGRFCDKHQKKHEENVQKSKRDYDKNRGSATKRGYNYRWQKAREQFLYEHPLCASCMKYGLIVPSKVVDHVIAHKGDNELFWDESNWQALCKSCHDRKTSKEDGGGWRK